MEPRRAIYATPRAFVVAWLVSFVVMLALTGAAMQYANYVDRKSNRAWCELITGLDERYRSLPGDASPQAREFAAEVHELRLHLDCQ